MKRTIRGTYQLLLSRAQMFSDPPSRQGRSYLSAQSLKLKLLVLHAVTNNIPSSLKSSLMY